MQYKKQIAHTELYNYTVYSCELANRRLAHKITLQCNVATRGLACCTPVITMQPCNMKKELLRIKTSSSQHKLELFGIQRVCMQCAST
jgi:hypothetical protein